MISERHIILLNKKIDGCLDANESAEIETVLATDADARDLYRRMVEIAEKLGTLEPVDPPPDLESNVLSAIARPCSLLAHPLHTYSSCQNKPYLWYPR